MNLPNKLTLGRVVLSFLFLFVLVLNFPFSKNCAFFIFIIAAVTDWIDGQLARKYNLITNFGKLMDPLADKILTAAALICFVAIEPLHVPAWMVVIVICREFSVSGMRTLAASQGVVLSASRSGKHKLASQVIFIVLMLLMLSVREWGMNVFEYWTPQGDLYLAGFSWWLMLVVLIYAVVSGTDFFMRNAKILFKDI